GASAADRTGRSGADRLDGKEDEGPPVSAEQTQLESYLYDHVADISGRNNVQIVRNLIAEYADLGHLGPFFAEQFPMGMREEQFGWFLVQSQDESADSAARVFRNLQQPWCTKADPGGDSSSFTGSGASGLGSYNAGTNNTHNSASSSGYNNIYNSYSDPYGSSPYGTDSLS
ncbi:unnamed protein product, partial [Amoebophrya sp. A25]